jgi:hypothetical protein
MNLEDISKATIQSRLYRSKLTRKQLAEKCGYSKSAIDKVMAGIGSDACKQAVVMALGLLDPDYVQDTSAASSASAAVNGNGLADLIGSDAPPVVRAGSIVGKTTDSGLPVGQVDVVLPGALVLMARDRKLPFDQVVKLTQVYGVLVNDGGTSLSDIPESEWNDLYAAVEPWL